SSGLWFLQESPPVETSLPYYDCSCRSLSQSQPYNPEEYAWRGRACRTAYYRQEVARQARRSEPAFPSRTQTSSSGSLAALSSSVDPEKPHLTHQLRRPSTACHPRPSR